MPEDAPRRIKGYRTRNEDGLLRKTREDKHVETLEKHYSRDFGVRGDMDVGTLLEKIGMESVNDLIQRKRLFFTQSRKVR